MAAYVYKRKRHGVEERLNYRNLDKALSDAWWDAHYDLARPIKIWRVGKSEEQHYDREAMRAWWEAHGYGDEESVPAETD